MRLTVKKKQRVVTCCALFVVICTTAAGIVNLKFRSGNLPEARLCIVPWKSIGGCGVGGGSATGGASVRWIGRGAPGALLDMEMRLGKSVINATGGGMASRNYTTIPLTFGFHPHIMDLTLSMPLQWKEEITSESSEKKIAGIGDISFSLAKGLGMEGQLQVQWGLTLPTGRADIYDLGHQLVVSDMQLGSGVFGTNLAVDYTITREWGMVMVGGTYSTALLYLSTTETTWDYELERAESVRKKLAWARDKTFSYINDKEVRRSDMIDIHAYLGIKREYTMHSFGITPSVPIAPDDGSYVLSENVSTFAFSPALGDDAAVKTEKQALDSLYRFIDSDTGDVWYPADDTLSYAVHKADTEWVAEKKVTKKDKELATCTFSYAMEISNSGIPFPILLYLSLPLVFDTEDKVGFSGYSVGIGLKYMLF
ncbi:MAG: hypothetical protein GF350_05990 [Chitinivibrionales bacterium]|nr:hypothetical protein [Chitinivibrionales bacterium]